MNNKLMKEKIKMLEKLIAIGYDTDKKITDMKVEELILLTNFNRTNLSIAVGLKNALSSKSFISYLCDTIEK